MSKIVYLCHYSRSQDKRMSSPAGVTMMDYVIGSINNAGYELTVFSPSQTISGERTPKEHIKYNEKTELIYARSLRQFAQINIPMRFVQLKRREAQLYKELLNLIDNGDTLVVYHSLALMSVISRLRKKRSFKLVLQVCEIYADVLEKSGLRKKEVEFISNADAYIFSSVLLESELNIHKRDYVICLGTYGIEQDRALSFDDEKIHVVYAGTLDPRKGGAISALGAAEFLDERYHMHILGFGSDDETAQLTEKIEEISKRTSCEITYDGCLLGEEYTRFLQKCHIGLSTQMPDAKFNATSFPSKILVYMSNGLRVVSVKILAVETSSVASAMHFYERPEPQQIANAILSVDISKSDEERKIISSLDKEFVSDIRELLK